MQPHVRQYRSECNRHVRPDAQTCKSSKEGIGHDAESPVHRRCSPGVRPTGGGRHELQWRTGSVGAMHESARSRRRRLLIREVKVLGEAAGPSMQYLAGCEVDGNS